MAEKLRFFWIQCACAASFACACAGVVGGDAKPEAPVLVQKMAPAAADRTREPTIVCDRLVEDFASTPVGEFPRGWETRRSGELELARTENAYVVVRDAERRALRARSISEPVTIGRGIEQWDLERYPIVAWEWKVSEFPANADETRSDADDTGASVSAVWSIGLPFMVRQIRYTYSTTLASGTRASNRLGHDQLLVLASRTAGGGGEWRRARVDLLRHYREFFERDDATAPTGIALTTDADDTGTRAEAFYANFRLCRYRSTGQR